MAHRNDRMLTLERPHGPDRARRDRHRRRRLHRHAGPPAGQAAARAVLPRRRRSSHGTEGCNYLLAVDIDMNTVDGYAISSWEKGYGDMEFVLDYDTIRLLPHLPGTRAGPVRPGLARPRRRSCQSPRTILKKQLARAADAGYVALAGTELEFIVFDDTYEDAWNAGYRDLTPATSTTSTTPSSVRRGWSRCCATSATRCTPPAWSSRARRASATSASTRSASSTTRRW